MPATTDPLPSWNEAGARQAIVEFVEAVTGADRESYLPPEERVAVFDNDGTLWCEKPMPIELGFILQRLAAMAAQDASLRDRQPWKAAHDKDYHWLGDVIVKHYHGDDSDVKVLMGGILQAFAGMTVDDYGAAAQTFVHQGRHPTLGRTFRDCGYRPMIELLGYLEANGSPATSPRGVTATSCGRSPIHRRGRALPGGGQGERLDGGQHQARLGDRLRPDHQLTGSERNRP